MAFPPGSFSISARVARSTPKRAESDYGLGISGNAPFFEMCHQNTPFPAPPPRLENCSRREFCGVSLACPEWCIFWQELASRRPSV